MRRSARFALYYTIVSFFLPPPRDTLLHNPDHCVNSFDHLFFFVSSCGSIMSPRTLSPGHFVFEKFRQIGMSDTRICNCAGKIHEEFVNMCRCNWGFFLGFRFFSAALYEARYESGSRKLCPTDNFKLRCQFGSV